MSRNSDSADDEWSPLRAAIVGKVEHSCFPNEPLRMIRSTMPAQYYAQFRPDNPFPASILQHAKEELEQFVSILREEGTQVYRDTVEWRKVGGYTGAMP